MSFFNNLSEKLQQIKQDFNEKQDFKTQLINICKDGKITEKEIAYIEQLAEEYGLEEKDLQKVNVSAYKAAFNAILKDGILTEDEEYNIYFIQNFLEIDDKKIKNELQILQHHAQLREIQKGNLPIIDYMGIILQNNELIHFLIPAQILEERVVSKEYQGGSSGVSIRIAKGVSFRLGQHKGKMVSKSAIIPVDSGSFIVTNKRIMFKGKNKSYAYPFSQLIGFSVYTDGIEISTNKGVTRIFKITQSYDPDILNLIIHQASMQLPS